MCDMYQCQKRASLITHYMEGFNLPNTRTRHCLHPKTWHPLMLSQFILSTLSCYYIHPVQCISLFSSGCIEICEQVEYVFAAIIVCAKYYILGLGGSIFVAAE